MLQRGIHDVTEREAHLQTAHAQLKIDVKTLRVRHRQKAFPEMQRQAMSEVR